MNNLKPFKKNEDFTVSSDVSLNGSKLSFQFKIEDLKSKLKLPDMKDSAKRVIGLWDNACFEAFWSYEGSPSYFEMNLSPNGNWNVFEFVNYRSPGFPNLKESRAWRLTSYKRSENSFAADFETEVAFESGRSLDFSLNAILVTKSGEKSFWALEHFGEKPDFHKRESFLLKKKV